jgi:hypothetical protein
MVPSIKRVALVFNPETSPQSRLFLTAVEVAAPALGVEVMPAPVHSTAEVEAALARLAPEPNIGLIFPGTTFNRLRANSRPPMRAAASSSSSASGLRWASSFTSRRAAKTA